MHLRWSLYLVLAACGLGAQTLDSNSQFLLDRAKADRDIFGAGRADGFSLETQVQKSNSDIQLRIHEHKWIESDESDPELIGTERGADLYLRRTIRASDIVVSGRVLQQISILNTNQSKIVTDSLVQVEDVLYSKQAFDFQTGSTLVIARLGGRAHINGHAVSIQVDHFPPFITGGSYLFFLHKSPTSDSFLVESEDAFDLNSNGIHAVRNGQAHPAVAFLKDKGAFVDAVRKAGAEAGR
jgi:hypothetical protein